MTQNRIFPSIFLVIYVIAALVFLSYTIQKGFDWMPVIGFVIAVAMAALKIKQIKDIKAREEKN